MSDNYLLPFDSLLPVEILYQIIQYVGIENLIQLLPIPVSPYLQSSFIHHNLNIKRAIDNLIVDSNITFNNRLVQHSYISKNTIVFTEKQSSVLAIKTINFTTTFILPITKYTDHNNHKLLFINII